jgi:peptidoglycan/LPS O-acetylase OafA/YrhL
MQLASKLGELMMLRLSRTTSTGRFIPEIDGLRFIAIGFVVLFHLNGTFMLPENTHIDYPIPPQKDLLGRFLQTGNLGVELFFVISGFILALPFANMYLKGIGSVNLKQYFLRRITRLEPPYILCLLLFYVKDIVLKGASPGELFPHLLAGLGYMHGIIYHARNPVNFVTWSLEIEVQFYILAPLLALIFTLNSRTARLLVYGLIIAVCVLLLPQIAPAWVMRYTLAGYLPFFMLGFILVESYIELHETSSMASYTWDWIALASLIGFLVARAHNNNIIFIIAVFFFYKAVFKSKLVRNLFRSPWTTIIGGMCYSIYLLHSAIITFLTRFTSHFVIGEYYWLNLLLQAVLIIPAICFISALYFIAVEKPCMHKDWPAKMHRTLTNRFSSRNVKLTQE